MAGNHSTTYSASGILGQPINRLRSLVSIVCRSRCRLPTTAVRSRSTQPRTTTQIITLTTHSSLSYNFMTFSLDHPSIEALYEPNYINPLGRCAKMGMNSPSERIDWLLNANKAQV